MIRAAFLLLVALVLAGCAGHDYVMIAPRPPAHYEKLGLTEGTGCGSAWLVFFVFDARMADAGYPGRVARARAEALAKVPGAIALTDVVLQETTTWWLLGVTDCVTLRGQAIR